MPTTPRRLTTVIRAVETVWEQRLHPSDQRKAVDESLLNRWPHHRPHAQTQLDARWWREQWKHPLNSQLTTAIHQTLRRKLWPKQRSILEPDRVFDRLLNVASVEAKRRKWVTIGLIPARVEKSDLEGMRRWLGLVRRLPAVAPNACGAEG